MSSRRWIPSWFGRPDRNGPAHDRVARAARHAADRLFVDRLERRTLLAAVASIAFDVDSPAHDLVVTFDAPIDPASLAASDLIVRRVGTDTRVDPAGFAVALDAANTRATFAKAGGFPEGDYTVQLLADDVLGADGHPLAADAALDFFYKWGDATGPAGVRDRASNAADLALVGDHYGLAPATFSQGDLDYDGVVGEGDAWMIDEGTLPEPVTGATGFTARVVQGSGQDHVELSWVGGSAVSQHFTIGRSADRGRTFTTLVAALAPDRVTYVDAAADVTGVGTYLYRIRSTEPLNPLTGQRAPGRHASTQLHYGQLGTAPAPIQPPVDLTVAGVTKNTLALAWVDASTGETGHEVWRSTGGDFTLRATLNQPDATGWTDVGLKAGRTYQYKLRTIGASTSGYSNEASGTTLGGAPAAISGGVEPAAPTHLVAEFDQPIFANDPSLDHGDVGVYALTGGRQYVGGAGGQFMVSGISGDKLRIVMQGALRPGYPAGVLPDGNYELIVRGDAIRNAAGQTIADSGDPDREGIADAFFFVGDFDANRVVDFADLVRVAQHYNTPGRTYAQGDADLDGAVGFRDLVTLAQRYGTRLLAPLRGVNQLQASTGPLLNPDVDPSGTAMPWNAAYVEWTPPDAAAGPFDGYRVWRSADGVNFGEPIAELPATQLSYVDRGLIEGERYTYRVRPFTHARGNGEATNRASVATPLRAPTNVATRAVSHDAIRVTWTDNAANEDRYDVEVFDAAGNFLKRVAAPANATSLVVTGLDEATGYQVYVVAATAAHFGRPVLPAAARTRLAAPTDVTFADASGTTATVRWTDRSAREAGHAVRWFAAEDFTHEGRSYAAGDLVGESFVAATAGATGTARSATLAGLPEGQNLYFDVTAKAGAASAADASGTAQSGNTRGGPAVGRPVTGVTATPVLYGGETAETADELHRGADRVDITWTHNGSNVAHYYVWMESPARALLAVVPAAHGSGGQHAYTATALDPNQAYTFSVQPEVADAPAVATAKSREAQTGLQVAGQGVGFWVEEVDGHSATLRWNPVEGDATFVLLRQSRAANGALGEAVEIGSLGASANKRVVSGLQDATTYVFTLRIVYHGDRYAEQYLQVTTPEDTSEEASDRQAFEDYADLLAAMTREERDRLAELSNAFQREHHHGLGWYRGGYDSPKAAREWEPSTEIWRNRLVSQYGERSYDQVATRSDGEPRDPIPRDLKSRFRFWTSYEDGFKVNYEQLAPEGLRPLDGEYSWTEADASIVNDDGTYNSNSRGAPVGASDWWGAAYLEPGVTIRYSQQSSAIRQHGQRLMGQTRYLMSLTYTRPTYELNPNDGFLSESDAPGDDHADEGDGEGDDEERSPRPSGVAVTASTATTNTLRLVDNSTNEEGIEVERSRDGQHWALIATVRGAGGGPRSAGDPRGVTLTDGGLSPGVEYQYRARAFKWTKTNQALDDDQPVGPGNVLHALEFTRWSGAARGLTDAQVGVWAETPRVVEGQQPPGRFGVHRLGEAGEAIDVAMQIGAGPTDASYVFDYLLDQPSTQPQNGSVVDFTFGSAESVEFVDVDVSMADAEAEDDEPIRLRVASAADADPLYEPVAGLATITIAKSVAPVVFIDAAGNETEELKVAKWQGAFDGEGAVKNDFIDSDPDRFKVRVTDLARKGSGTVVLTLSSDSDGTAYDDDATQVTLTETGLNTGVFESKTQMMMSDDPDDDFAVDNVADDTPGDRTHIVALEGVVKAHYTLASGEMVTKSADVPVYRTVLLNVNVLRIAPGGESVVADAVVQEDIARAKERFAQAAIKLVATVNMNVNIPAGVTLHDGVERAQFDLNNQLVLTAEERALFGAGLRSPIQSVEIYYVTRLSPNARAQAYPRLLVPGIAHDNSVIMSAAERRPLTLAHEIGHVLEENIAGHYEGAFEPFNLMRAGTGVDNSVLSTKRLTQGQGDWMRTNSFGGL